MIGELAWAISVAAAVAARPQATEGAPTGERHRSASDAVRAALESSPVVVGFGEWHQTAATAAIPSALRRFTDAILPTVATEISHLIVETWITTGRCGEAERRVTEDVRKTTERPVGTEGEIETLIRAGVAAGIAPRILTLACADYEAMLQGGAQMDYDRTLRITARALEAAVLGALRERWQQTGAREGRAMVGVYGGALHNDVHPQPDLLPYSFAPVVMAATLGRYVEIDLVVPEYAARLASIRAAPWWKTYVRLRRPGFVVLIRQSARSFVVVFPARQSAR